MYNLGFCKRAGKWVIVVYHDLDLNTAFDRYPLGAGVLHVSDTIEGAMAKAGQYDVDLVVIINHHTVYYCMQCGKRWMADSLTPERYYEDIANGFSSDGKGNIVIHSGVCLSCDHII